MRKPLLAMLAACALLSASAVPAGDLPIGSFADGVADAWRLSVGMEFPGAQGCFHIEKSKGAQSGFAASLEGSFKQGGAYVGIEKKLVAPLTFKALKFRVKTSDATYLIIRLRDSKGVHQHLERLTASGDWQTVSVRSFNGERYKAWGKAENGVFMNPLTGMSILLEAASLKDGLMRGKVLISDISLEE